MKYIFFLIIINLTYFSKCDLKTQKPECQKFLNTVFNEDFFFIPEPGKLNLVGIDTITILDQNEYLNSCAKSFNVTIAKSLITRASKFDNIRGKEIKKKTIIIINKDNLSSRIRSYNATSNDAKNPKYKCYFILKNFKISGDSINIQLDKLISNQSIRVGYLYKKGVYKLYKKEIGQY